MCTRPEKSFRKCWFPGKILLYYKVSSNSAVVLLILTTLLSVKMNTIPLGTLFFLAAREGKKKERVSEKAFGFMAHKEKYYQREERGGRGRH